MPFGEFEVWRRELLATSDLVQDDDDSIDEDEAERRWNRYVELAGNIDGTEGPWAVHVLITSLTALQDYGAHEAVFGALERFPPGALGRGTVMAAAELLTIPDDRSGHILQLLSLLSNVDHLQAFGVAFAELPSNVRAGLESLIARHENNEWLADERTLGRLRALNV